MKTTLPRVPEKAVQAHIVECLRRVGATVYVLGHPSPNDGRAQRGTGQTPGVPDLLAFVRPKEGSTLSRRAVEFLCIEVKAQGGRLSPAQRQFCARCEEAGVPYLVGDLDAVLAWLMTRGLVRRDQVPHYRLPKE